MWELGIQPRDNVFFRLLTRLENSFLSRYGAQSFTVSVKPGPRMFCFLCGELSVEEKRLSQFYLPICQSCGGSDLTEYYRQARMPKFCGSWSFGPEFRHGTPETCNCCGKGFLIDEIFEDYGCAVPVCGDCLRNPEVNIELSNKFVKPVWRSLR